jgi:NAD(P)-dependent dehydrogenase (short-subunit alcohol dehydrogenase family)
MTILDRFSLQGRVVVLTGAAGLYGRGLAATLAEAGARLVIASRDLARLQQVAAEETARGYTVVAEPLDQGEERSVLGLRDQVVAQFGRIDGLVNNSVLRPMRSPDDPVAAWEASLRVNGTGVFLMTRAFGQVMCAQQSGSIVNVSSIQGLVGPSLELYAGTDMGTPPPDYFFHKGGLLNLTRYYAGLFGPHAVRVNAVSPGGFFNHQPEPFLTRYCEHTMLGRMADSTDLGGAVVFLLSDAARYITGANLAVDGGYSAK